MHRPVPAKGKRPTRMPRLLRGLAFAVLGILLLPYALTPLYAVLRPVSTLMLWRQITGEPVRRTYVSMSRIANTVKLAVLIAEDQRFCEHHGVDFGELREAIQDAENWEDMRGGSTITQQVAKNLFLWQGRSYVRKALEFPLALWIDLILSKKRILEIYLNIAEWGPEGQFGIEAGSQSAFGRPASGLSPHQAALLAAMLPNPHDRDARRPGPELKRLADLYVSRAARAPQTAACVR
jgi:monofunctional biosynthetic peptidoglycan transglycosylase